MPTLNSPSKDDLKLLTDAYNRDRREPKDLKEPAVKPSKPTVTLKVILDKQYYTRTGYN